MVGTAQLMGPDGSMMGTVDLFTRGSDLMVSVDASGLDEGAHGFHLHTTGRCDRPDFTSAGGHLNPGDNPHGRLSPGDSHLGDLPNIVAGPNGNASATVPVSGSPSSALNYIFDADGTAVIVHAGADDYRSQPSGDAGSRVACGVLSRS
ncbi:MAG: superoxide dismutase family protein [Erythrobacter sp.]